MGRSLETMARAIATLRLALPERAGVSSRPEELSHQLSQPEAGQSEERVKRERFPILAHEQPIELPQLRHL
jgi:hypothetical protein